MVQAVITIPDDTNRVLNIVKAKFGLKDKSQVIKLIVDKYEENFLEPEFKPEYLNKINKIEDENFTKYDSLDSFENDLKNA